MKMPVRFAVLIGAVSILLAACQKDTVREPNEILQYIPADTPYVIAVTEPLPDDLLDKMEPAINDTLSAYRKMMEIMIAEAETKMAGDEGAAEKAEQFEPLLQELMSLMSIQGLEDAGMGRGSLFALYGDGLLPVMRLSLTDGAKFEATLARFEEKAGKKLDTGELDGVPYRYLDIEDKIRLVIATPMNHVVFTVAPVAYDDARLAQAIGTSKPASSLDDSADLGKMMQDYGFTNHLTSFIDIERVAATFLGDPSGLNAELLALAEYDATQFSETCRSEFAGLAAIAPRMVMGYTEVSTERLEALMVLELREDIAEGLAALPATVPGLGTDPGGLFTFGFGMDLMALRNFYEARLDAIEADPFECEALAELQAGVAKGREVLNQPVPPMVYSFRGFLASVTDIGDFDMAAQKPPESVDASVLIAMENAQDLVNMAALMSPEVAALNLLPDGEAKLIDLPQLSELPGELFAALSSDGLSLALGEGAGGRAEAMLEASAVEPPPLMAFSMDAKRYYEFIGEAVMQAEDPAEGEAMPQDMKEVIRDIMVSSGSIYERLTTNMHLTERGIEFGTSVTLAD